jgi:hypothetical protein
MNSYKNFISLIVLILSSVYSIAQQDITKVPTVIPPSPNAAELGRYGNFNVGLNTGSANVKIPLLSFQNGLVPVSLDYSTTGIKVDQLASRAGMGWVLNAGGIITRSVMGKPDELSTRTTPNSQVMNQALLDNLFDISNGTFFGKDAEPDVFIYNFDGHSGKFILDSSGNAVQIPYTNLKITKGVGQFTIITPEGATYLFSNVEKTYSYSATLGFPNSPTSSLFPTSWYLTSITLPNQDLVSFTYTDTTFTYYAATSETMQRTYDGQNQAAECSGQNACGHIDNDMVSKSFVFVQSKLLSSISYKSAQITFSYIGRSDVPGDRLYSNVKLLDNGTVLKSIDLNYTDAQSAASTNFYFTEPEFRIRPFLVSVVERGSNLQEVRKHTFTYNDMNGLPYRFSYSQDDYGFYNGKYNAHLVPLPDNTDDQLLFWQATADRSCDFNYAVKGSLATVAYPTGGMVSINYENNTVSATQTNPPTTGSTLTNIIGTATLNQVQQSAVFTLPNFDQSLTKYTIGMLTSVDPNDPPGSHIGDYMLFEIVKNSNGAVVFSRSLTYAQNVTAPLSTLVGGTAYYLRITAVNIDVNIRRYSATLTYATSGPTTVPVNKLVGGLRVKKFITADGNGNNQVKRYYYTYLSDTTKSSGIMRYPLRYKVNNETEPAMFCGGPDGGHLEPVTVSCYSAYMYSTSYTNIYAFGSYHVNYESVIESIGGDYYEGGGVEHLYHAQADLVAQIEFGMYFLVGSKLSVTGHLNGLEKQQTLFKKVSGTIVNVKKMVDTFVIDPAITQTLYAFDVKKRYDYALGPLTVFDPVELTGYDVQKYRYESRWVHKYSTATTEYDPLGVATLTTVQNYTYGNPLHTQVTETSTINSEGQTLKEKDVYPHEMVSMGKDPTGLYQQMINRNMVTSVIEKTSYNNNVQTGFIGTYYSSPYSDIYVPANVQAQKRTSDPLEMRMQFHAYDNIGNLLSVSKDGGPKNAYLWGYQQQLPTAECRNADVSQIAYTSFESEANGNWNGVTAGNIVSTYSITGRMAYSQSGFSLTRTGMTSGNAYIVSYWTRNASAYTVTGTQSGYPLKGRSVDGWTYYEHLVSGVTTITISGSGYIDELRAYPQTAQMSTYTYDPEIGKTSQCDINNIITYYEYDAFQRLYLVRDLDRNIVKKLVYDYYGSPSSDAGGL